MRVRLYIHTQRDARAFLVSRSVALLALLRSVVKKSHQSSVSSALSINGENRAREVRSHRGRSVFYHLSVFSTRLSVLLNATRRITLILKL